MLKLGHFSESRSEVPEDLEMWCWKSMEKISFTDRMGEVLNRVRKERNNQHTIKKKRRPTGLVISCIVTTLARRKERSNRKTSKKT